MECGKLTAKLRDAVPVCFIVDGKEVKRFKNIEIPDEIKQLPFIDFKFDVPTTGAITINIMFEAGVLPEVWPEARQRKQRGSTKLPEVQAAEAAVEAAIMAGLEQADAEGQPVREVAEMIEQGAEVTTEIEGSELIIMAEEPETMEIAFNLTGIPRKDLVIAVSAYTGEEPVYQNAPTFAYKIGSSTVDKNGTLTGPKKEALIESLRMQGFKA